MRNVLTWSAMALLATLPLRAQLPTISDVDRGGPVAIIGPMPKWDVAVIKPHPPEDHAMSWRMMADSMNFVNLSLQDLLCMGWNMKPYQISGLTGWMKSTRFDLTAKISSDDVEAYKKLNITQRRLMLQQLLTERFQLKFHIETKTLPTYDLVVDKGGPKLQTTTALDAPSPEEGKAHPEKYKKGQMRMGPGEFEGDGIGISQLASQLANSLEKPVRDATGLTGAYDIKVRYRPEDTATDNGDMPSIFSAVQELGLRLVASKGPVETLVIDAAQKPEDN